MNEAQRTMKAVFMHLLAFWLLWEWLVPLKTISDTGNIYVFIIFVAGCLGLAFFRVRFWLGALVKSLYIFYVLNMLFFQQPLLSVSLVVDLTSMAVHHFYLLIHFQFAEMTDSFRTLLFFLLLWISAYLLCYWLFAQKRLFLFYALTVGYVAVLDTFTAYQGKAAMIRLVVLGFLLLSWLHYERLVEKEKLLSGNRTWWKPFVFFASVSLLISYTAPKLQPQWPDPVPFIKSYAGGGEDEEEGKEPAVKKIGYGTNDSRLGGPFVADDTVVFYAEAKKRHYWRVETKDVYTGKGWEASESVEIHTFERENDVLKWFEENVEKEMLTAAVNFHQRLFPHLVYPAGLTSVIVSGDVVFRLHAANEKIYVTNRESYAVRLGRYEMTYEYPSFSVEKLRQAPVMQDSKLLQRYTQLPPNLPERVKELARQITNGKENQYDKVKAVEQYFRLNGYFYETKEVAVPSEQEDYVDQFLFETKKGYCDNFSTSMIVLLRSVGIPARWVKGYTSGQLVNSEENGMNVYEITNNNAHSWVEVYFEGIGWVPFEPTQGFSNPYSFTEQQSIAETTPIPEQTQREERQTPLNDELQKEDKRSSNVNDKLTAVFASLSWKEMVLGMFSLLVVSFILFKTKRKWRPYITLWLFHYRRDQQIFTKAYLSLLKHLDDYGLKRKSGQTLRQYAAYVDDWFGTNEMSRLTFLYEKAIYEKDHVHIEWAQVKELWENLIKKTVS
ncbi:transglutaminase superfamily protein [Anoxybacillus vitaminiphilus]|uniref:Transglutaminase superfamily protein n=1 Tax=Paranoxybacillus vitaminiphilus TaxID=581036 RepID=A0A327Y2W3_9BACL|nr:transglutaminase domain-containing protein [Anoxybacillus vitaminiphilus]RAK14095.1 transglutaminase superfamily protein [Anoxybacillus vitaminiphilus]